ncbi:MAG: sigma-70 family RNA polymerase sigma factor [Leeuwenhoekiella sp.]
MKQPDELILQLKQGNEMAFQKIYGMYSESLFGVINTILRDESLSQEVLQDVFVKIWEKADSYNSKKGRFFTWMLNIARNAAIDKTRSKSYKNQNKNLSQDFVVNMLEQKTSFVTSVDAIGITKYLKALKPVCKKVINLLFFQGFTQKEASEELEMPLGTVKTHNRNCLKSLRVILAD